MKEMKRLFNALKKWEDVGFISDWQREKVTVTYDGNEWCVEWRNGCEYGRSFEIACDKFTKSLLEDKEYIEEAIKLQE